ncbi:MAG: hypothetical protein ABIC04_05780, partial [Nanoarchaeota archaeon]
SCLLIIASLREFSSSAFLSFCLQLSIEHITGLGSICFFRFYLSSCTKFNSPKIAGIIMLVVPLLKKIVTDIEGNDRATQSQEFLKAAKHYDNILNRIYSTTNDCGSQHHHSNSNN